MAREIIIIIYYSIRVRAADIYMYVYICTDTAVLGCWAMAASLAESLVSDVPGAVPFLCRRCIRILYIADPLLLATGGPSLSSDIV